MITIASVCSRTLESTWPDHQAMMVPLVPDVFMNSNRTIQYHTYFVINIAPDMQIHVLLLVFDI